MFNLLKIDFSNWTNDDLISLGTLALAIVVAVGSTVGWVIDRIGKNAKIADVTRRLEFLLNNKLSSAQNEINRFIERCKDDIELITREISFLEYRVKELLRRISRFSDERSIPPEYISALEADKDDLLGEIEKLRTKLSEIEERKLQAEQAINAMSKVDASSAKQMAEIEDLINEAKQIPARNFSNAITRANLNAEEQQTAIRLEGSYRETEHAKEMARMQKEMDETLREASLKNSATANSQKVTPTKVNQRKFRASQAKSGKKYKYVGQ